MTKLSNFDTMTLGQIASLGLGAEAVLRRHGLDFCCGGNRTTLEAIPESTVRRRLQQEVENAGVNTATAENPAQLPPLQLIDYIVEHHHSYLRQHLPTLQAHSSAVCSAHGTRFSHVFAVHKVLSALAAELDIHLVKEEQQLFPAMREQSPALHDLLLTELEEEHQRAGQALADLERITQGFTPPDEACTTWKAFYGGLAELSTDLTRHVHLENNVLFPYFLSSAE